MTRAMNQWMSAWLSVAVAAWLAGCGGPDPTRLKLAISGSREINPNTANQPSPTVVRLYDLAQPDVFTAAPFEAIYDRDTETLGADLLGKRDMFIEPAGHLTIDQVLPAGTNALGILVAFRVLDGATWRLVLPIKTARINRYDVLVSAHAVGRAPRKPGGGFFGLF